MLGVVLHQLVAAGLGLRAFLEMLPYAMLVSLQFAVPSTLLFAVCSVFGRMAADNEIVAVTGAGVHPMRVITPVLLLSLVISPILVWINDLAMSQGQPGLNRVVMHSLEDIVYGFLRSNGSYASQSGFLIHVEDVQDRWLIHPTIMITGGTDTTTIVAEKASISLNAENETLVINLVNWQSDNGTAWSLDGGKDSMVLEMPLEKAARKSRESVRISEVAFSEMAVVGGDLMREKQTYEQALLSRCSTAMVSGRYGLFSDSLSLNQLAALKDIDRRKFRLACEPWRRWALGFCCFSFTILGVPMAIWKRSADYWSSFGVCFLPILVIYYPLFALGVDRAKNGQWPPFSPFLGNICITLMGLVLLRKVCRS